MTLILSIFLLGLVAGSRAALAPAFVSGAAFCGWVNLGATPFAFMGYTAAAGVTALLAAGELVMDKLPSTPSRTQWGPLFGRIGSGVFCGVCFAAAANYPLGPGALMGGAGAFAGTFLGFEIRTVLVRALKVKDIYVALLEDTIAITLGVVAIRMFLQ